MLLKHTVPKRCVKLVVIITVYWTLMYAWWVRLSDLSVKITVDNKCGFQLVTLMAVDDKNAEYKLIIRAEPWCLMEKPYSKTCPFPTMRSAYQKRYTFIFYSKAFLYSLPGKKVNINEYKVNLFGYTLARGIIYIAWNGTTLYWRYL